jgi:hypothetical protein
MGWVEGKRGETGGEKERGFEKIEIRRQDTVQ